MAAIAPSGFHAKCYVGMSGEVVEVGPFLLRELDKEAPPAVLAAKLKRKLHEIQGQRGQIKLVSIAGAATLADDAMCELDSVDTADVEVTYQVFVETIPDQLFLMVSSSGDEGCKRVCTQEVTISEAFSTKEAAEAFNNARKADGEGREFDSGESDADEEFEMRRVSMQKIKTSPEAMAKLGDNVYALLKVETDGGGPSYPYFSFYKYAFVDRESAADLAIKFYHGCIWNQHDSPNVPEKHCDAEGGSDDDGLRRCSSTLSSDFENNSDCEDHLQDMSCCKRSSVKVLETYGISIWIVELNLPPKSGKVQHLHGGIIQGTVCRKKKTKEASKDEQSPRKRVQSNAKESSKMNKAARALEKSQGQRVLRRPARAMPTAKRPSHEKKSSKAKKVARDMAQNQSQKVFRRPASATM
eukprot:TRINITY_DN27066_c0_g1_i1.p1 TRINITY_DN27066_c0_g1~~TRINITY_DN27066_c0_g1_i1.p1  ORF type:complete len:413 (-),score=84.55 TRINITY_DN27066_c0_g1_i1:109-1347(-)